MKQQTKMMSLAVILGLIGIYFHPHAEALEPNMKSITCIGKDEVFVIPSVSITHKMIGMYGFKNCLSAIDTTGKVRVICKEKDSPYLCYYSKNMEI